MHVKSKCKLQKKESTKVQEAESKQVKTNKRKLCALFVADLFLDQILLFVIGCRIMSF